jgi:hypothetical protein
MTRLRPLGCTLACALALAACKKPEPPGEAARAATLAGIADAVKEQALRDLQNDVVLLKAQLGVVTAMATAAAAEKPPARAGRVDAALYTCERLALAGRELADDARAQALLGEADALCAYQAPMAAGELKLAALQATRGAEPPPKSAPADCGPIRDALNKVGAKYRNDSKIVELFGRFKTDCPRMRLFATARAERPSSSGGGSSAPDPRVQRDACKKRCDDASFDCRSRCMYCGSCTSDKTWEWCNATCNSCKQGCEQNERFCQSSCGS